MVFAFIFEKLLIKEFKKYVIGCEFKNKFKNKFSIESICSPYQSAKRENSTLSEREARK